MLGSKVMVILLKGWICLLVELHRAGSAAGLFKYIWLVYKLYPSKLIYICGLPLPGAGCYGQGLPLVSTALLNSKV